MKTLIDTQGKTLEEIMGEMDFTGYAHFDLSNYKAKNNLPCFISENSDDISDVESYQSMFDEVYRMVKTKQFLLAVCEHYDREDLIDLIEKTNEKAINYISVYLSVTDESPKEFTESFLDSYFLSGDEIWCSISTKLADYTN